MAKINILGKIPRKVSVMLSGGVDSVAIHDFLSNNHEVEILYFNHGETDISADCCESFVRRVADSYNQKIVVGNANREKHKSESLEEYWRDMRYEWVDSLNREFVVTGHHLNDVVETWVWSSLNGTPKTIPYKRNNVYRPFLTTHKTALEKWADKKELSYVNDITNLDNTRTRNYIRNVLLPHCYMVNKGLDKVVSNQVLKNYYLTEINS